MKEESEETSKETKYTAHDWRDARWGNRRGMGYAILAGFGAVFILIIIVGLISGVAFHHRLNENVSIIQDKGFGAPGMMLRSGERTQWNSTQANQQVLSGVVTGVNGTTFTLAGEGNTNSITTNDSTQYTNDTKPAVNDTVTVYGTTNNGVFTAQEVVVQ